MIMLDDWFTLLIIGIWSIVGFIGFLINAIMIERYRNLIRIASQHRSSFTEPRFKAALLDLKGKLLARYIRLSVKATALVLVVIAVMTYVPDQHYTPIGVASTLGLTYIVVASFISTLGEFAADVQAERHLLDVDHARSDQDGSDGERDRPDHLCADPCGDA